MSAPVAPAPFSPPPQAPASSSSSDVASAASSSSPRPLVPIALRRFQSSDASAFHVAMSDAECMRYWSCLPHESLAQTERYIERMMDSARLGQSDERVIVDARSGEVLGKVCMQWRPREGPPELGILIFPNHWRKGIAKRAVTMVIDEAFAEHASRTTSTTASIDDPEDGFTHPPLVVHADVDPRNEASLSLLQSVGFVIDRVEERTFKVGQTWVDSVYLTLTEEQFKAAATAQSSSKELPKLQ